MKTHKVIYYHACLFDAHKKTASECQQINHLCIYYKTHDFSWVLKTLQFQGFIKLWTFVLSIEIAVIFLRSQTKN